MTGDPERQTGTPTRFSAWRRRCVTLVLVTVAIGGIPALLLTLANDRFALSPGFRAFYIGEYASVWVLLLWRRADDRVRVALILLLCYAPAVVGLSRLGLAGTGRIYLMALPLLAFILGGSGWGLFGAAVTIATTAVFVALAATGVLDRTLVPAAGPHGADFWLAQTVVMLMLLIPIVLLLERFHRLQQETLAAERRVSASLREEQARSHRALTELVEQRRARHSLEAAMLDLTERERRSAGHELHDGVCQQITAALVRCRVLSGAEGADRATHLEALEGFLGDALTEAHALAQGLSPGQLAFDELPAALEEYSTTLAAALGKQAAIRVRRGDDLPSVDDTTTTQLYRIAQEAVRNALTHADARAITVSLGGPGAAILAIEDDGRGIGPGGPDGDGMGLRIMQYRAESLGGRCEVAPANGGGTRVAVVLPGARVHPDEGWKRD